MLTFHAVLGVRQSKPPFYVSHNCLESFHNPKLTATPPMQLSAGIVESLAPEERGNDDEIQ